VKPAKAKRRCAETALQLGRRAELLDRSHRGDFMQRARYYRLRAEEYRALAELMKNPTARASFRHLADCCDNLGRRLEEIAGGSESDGSQLD
jgi:hypothetical protein